MPQLIKFIKNRPWLNSKSPSVPGPTIKTIPDWYRKADRFAINPHTDDYWVSPHDGGKIPTWKACPAVFDVMGTGYVFKTPCDLEVFEDDKGEIQIKVLDTYNIHFVGDRAPMAQFVSPRGYHEKHFAWWSDWSVVLPEGYSALYTQPLNRFELPFLTTSGIIDNDKVHLPGTVPFFIAEGFTGIIPAGTPYAQLLPFKREDWVSEVDVSIKYQEMIQLNMENNQKYRVPDGGVYIKDVWTRRVYE